MGLFSNLFGKNYSLQPSNAVEVDISGGDHEFDDPRTLYIGGEGDVKVDMADGGTVTFVALNTGQFLPCAVKKVYQTDTTATNLIAIR